MRILACFKVIHDLEYITPEELLSLQNGSLDLSVFKKIIGSYDEAALETALRLAEDSRQLGEAVTIHGLTVGECEKRFFDNLFPLGFDDLIRIPAGADFLWRPEMIADSIAAFVKDRGEYDAIITGKQTGPGESGIVPHILASLLKLAFVPEIFSLKRCNRGIRVTFKTDAGRVVMTVTKPAVYAVGEAMYPYLRVPTLREKIAAESREPSIFSPIGTDVVSSQAHFLEYLFTMPRRECRMIETKDSEEGLNAFWDYIQNPGNP